MSDETIRQTLADIIDGARLCDGGYAAADAVLDYLARGHGTSRDDLAEHLYPLFEFETQWSDVTDAAFAWMESRIGSRSSRLAAQEVPVSEPATESGLIVHCDRCGDALRVPGALVFVPSPTAGLRKGMPSMKYHLCTSCWVLLAPVVIPPWEEDPGKDF